MRIFITCNNPSSYAISGVSVQHIVDSIYMLTYTAGKPNKAALSAKVSNKVVKSAVLARLQASITRMGHTQSTNSIATTLGIAREVSTALQNIPADLLLCAPHTPDRKLALNEFTCLTTMLTQQLK